MKEFRDRNIIYMIFQDYDQGGESDISVHHLFLGISNVLPSHFKIFEVCEVPLCPP